jgi:hypothetical protein
MGLAAMRSHDMEMETEIIVNFESVPTSMKLVALVLLNLVFGAVGVWYWWRHRR